MGVIINQAFPFPNMPHFSGTYIVIGECDVPVVLDFDTEGKRRYTLTVPYQHWSSVNAFFCGLSKPLYTANLVMVANSYVMHDLSQFIHGEFAKLIIKTGLTDFTDDGLIN